MSLIPSGNELVQTFDQIIRKFAETCAENEALSKQHQLDLSEISELIQDINKCKNVNKNLEISLIDKNTALEEFRRWRSESLTSSKIEISAVEQASKLKYELETTQLKLHTTEKDLKIQRGENERLIRAQQSLVRQGNVASSSMDALKKKILQLQREIQMYKVGAGNTH